MRDSACRFSNRDVCGCRAHTGGKATKPIPSDTCYFGGDWLGGFTATRDGAAAGRQTTRITDIPGDGDINAGIPREIKGKIVSQTG